MGNTLRRISSSRSSVDGRYAPRGALSRSNSEISMTTMPMSISEKARGKMRHADTTEEKDETDDGQKATTEEEDKEEEDEEEFVGKNGFIPTEQWIATWRDRLPLDSIQIILSELESYLSFNSDLPISLLAPSIPSPSPNMLIQLSSKSTHLHLQQFVASSASNRSKSRKFKYNDQSSTWLASLVYGRVYLNLLDLMRGFKVELFGVEERKKELGVGELVTEAAKMVLGKVRN